MGFYELKDGTMVEMIFDNNGKFVKFGDDAKKEDIEKVEKEILDWRKNILQEPVKYNNS